MTARVLIVRPYGIGNTILATPAMQLCRRLLPGARLEALLNPLGAETLGDWPVLDRVHLYPETPSPDEFDRVLIFEPASPKVNAPFLRHPGLVRRRHLDGWRSARFLHRHEVEANLDIAATLGSGEHPLFPLHCDVAEPPPDLKPAPGTVGVHIGGAQPHQMAKRFPRSFWVDLLRPIAERRPVLLVGWHEEAEESAAIAAAIGARSICGIASLRVRAGVIRDCAAFVATDGGMMHVAACVGTPVVALFSTTNMWRTRPWTPPGRSIVVRVRPLPSSSDLRAALRALTLLEEAGRHWLRLGAAGLVVERSGRWWSRR